MNLCVRTAIANAIGKSAELSSHLSTKVDAAERYAEAIESLHAAQETGLNLLQMVDDLEVAGVSLGTVGYSEEWLKTINVDGNFEKVVNLSMVGLVDTPTEKTKAAMEGIMDSIWGFIKGIWKFLVGLFNKIINFIKALIGIFRKEDNIVSKGINTILLVAGSNPTQVSNAIAEAVTKAFPNRTYDIRDLITRADTLLCLALYLGDKALIVSGKTRISLNDVDRRHAFFDETFVELANDNSARDIHDASNIKVGKNVILDAFMDDLYNHPDKLTASKVSLSEFNEFAFVRPCANIKDALSRAGVIVNVTSDKINLRIDGISESCKVIDYATVYSDPRVYAKLLTVFRDVILNRAAGGTAPGGIQMVADRMSMFKNIASRAVVYAERENHSPAYNSSEAMENFRYNKAFVCYSRWMMEVSQWLGSFITSFNVTFSELSKFSAVILKVVEATKSNATTP